MKLKHSSLWDLSVHHVWAAATNVPALWVKRQSNSTISISLPPLRTFSRPLYKHRVGRGLVSGAHPQHQGRRGWISISKETCIDFYGNPFWITYSQHGSCDADELLSMGGHTFSTANFAVTLDGRRIAAAGGCNRDITKEDCDRFIALLTKRYGEPEQGDGEWFPCRLYKWKLKDRTLTFAIHETDEHNELKLERVYHEEDNTIEIREGKRRNRTEGYFFVFDGDGTTALSAHRAWQRRYLLYLLTLTSQQNHETEQKQR